MNKLTPLNSKTILNNIELVFKTNNITKLNKPTYHFLMNIPGFIAHYDLYGFQSNYSNVADLINQLSNTDLQWGIDHYSTYGIEQYGKKYGESNAIIYTELIKLVEKYKDQSNNQLKDKIQDKLALLKELVKRAETDENFTEEILRKLNLL